MSSKLYPYQEDSVTKKYQNVINKFMDVLNEEHINPFEFFELSCILHETSLTILHDYCSQEMPKSKDD